MFHMHWLTVWIQKIHGTIGTYSELFPEKPLKNRINNFLSAGFIKQSVDKTLYVVCEIL